MTTAVAIPDASPSTVVSVPDVPEDMYERMMHWAHAADAVYEVAKRLCTTSFVPDAFRGKPDETAAAILAGMEVGLNPVAALRSFDVINGVAAARAITLRAIVQSKGHKMWVEGEPTDETVTVCGQRKGEAHVHRSTWTTARAAGLKLLEKDNWRKQKGAMLVARATSECARLTAADAILGIPYSSEEIMDHADVWHATVDTPEPVTMAEIMAAPAAAPPAAPAAPAANRAPAKAAKAAKAAAAKPDPPAGKTQATQARTARMYGLLGKIGKQDKELALVHIAGVIGREIESTKDMTPDEVEKVIDGIAKELETAPPPADATTNDAPERDGS